MYLQRTDNTRVRKSGKIAPFHPHVRGLHHGIHPNFLQTSPGLSSLAVLHAPGAVARHTSGNAPNATHTDPTTAQALQSPQTLCRSPPPTTLYRLRTDDRCPSQDPWCPAASDHLHARTPAHRRYPGAVLSGPGLFLCRLDRTWQHPCQWTSYHLSTPMDQFFYPICTADSRRIRLAS